MYSKVIIVVLSLLLIASIGVSLFLFMDKDYQVDINIDHPLPTAPHSNSENISEKIEITKTPAETPTPTTPVHSKIEINKAISIPLKDAAGMVTSNIEYKVIEYEFTNEIIVQGKKATAIEGREFLIVDIQLNNDHTNTIQINTQDYIKLAINDNIKDWMSPDIHNDPVEIQPVATKMTRVGFPINTSDNAFTIRLGGVDQEKLFIEINRDTDY